MSEPKANSNSSARPVGLFIAFITTSLAHAGMLFAAAWILHNNVGAIDWELTWGEAVPLGTLAVIWRMWLRQRV